ncbi:MAG: dihydrolipoyl dehydrogenase [Candidatus Ratteibacteria bacterium]|jgi:dihydrolipoamide dehydrogenase
MERFDAVVIGGGPGGYPCAIRASQNGLKVALVEKEHLGGTCLNRGCIPTKTLFHIAEKLFPAQFDGVKSETVWEWSGIRQWVQNQVVRKLRSGVGMLLKANGVTFFQGEGILQEPGLVRVDGKELSADKIILATGSRAIVPRYFAQDPRMLTSDTIWGMESLPKSIAIVGGGLIGCEFASILHAFGVRVSLYEMSDHLLPGKDLEVSEGLRKIFMKRGIKVVCGEKISSLDELEAEKVLWAAGRVPSLEEFERFHITVTPLGIAVSERCETNLPGIYAIGDLNGVWSLAYVATREGIVVGDLCAGKDRVMTYRNVPEAIFTVPEVGVCGYSEEEARKEGFDVEVGRFPFAGLGKAYAAGSIEGFVKVVTDRSTDKILGFHMLGQAATELVTVGAMAIANECTVEDLLQSWYCHPSFAESIMEALLEGRGTPIHVPRKRG